MTVLTISSKGPRSENDVEGAAFAIAVLHFMRARPPFETEAQESNESKADYEYSMMEEQIIQEYCPSMSMSTDPATAFGLMKTILVEAHRLHDILLSSDTLISALGKQRKAAWRRRGAK